MNLAGIIETLRYKITFPQTEEVPIIIETNNLGPPKPILVEQLSMCEEVGYSINLNASIAIKQLYEKASSSALINGPLGKSFPTTVAV